MTWREFRWSLLFAVVGYAILLALTYAFVVNVIKPAHAREGDWSANPPNIRNWYRSLMQPDNPSVSCCGEADAYEADDFEIEGDHYIAIITDTNDDSFPNGTFRRHIDPGTRIVVPNTKMKWDAGNPTGHGIVFMGAGAAGSLYCYVAPGGV